ncbi:hypothetical protein A6A19_00925 [Actinobacillus delphinicola]|uniref:phage virion morphogenesis protein n=1 Tax=Actinobacillus delphinicola TaxID=51161 RepID=UPI002441304E|nr:phage virion morphogenesis protein [Actinobacillus delphinicola]MDG6896592.1 hypothetical protein [Actinobacillus delphinicola]
MSNDFEEVQQRFKGLIIALAPSARLKLMRQISIDLAKNQRKRITAQQNPDGTAFAPRKISLRRRKKQNRIKTKKMFSKIKSARFLKRTVTDNGLTIGYSGKISEIASMHQYGGIERHGKKVYHMPQREILGVSKEDKELVEKLIMQQLS